MRAVNLLPGESSGGNFSLDRLLIGAIALTVIVIAAVGGGYFLEKSHATTAQQQLAQARAELARAQAQAAAHPATAKLQVPAVLSQEQPWHLALNTAISTRMPWDVFLAELEYVTPSRVVLTTLSVGSSGSNNSFGDTSTFGDTSGAPTTTLTIGGSAFNQHDLAVFMSTLARVPRVSDVSITSTGVDDTGIVTFQISAHVSLPVGITPPAPVTDTTTTTGAS